MDRLVRAIHDKSSLTYDQIEIDDGKDESINFHKFMNVLFKGNLELSDSAITSISQRLSKNIVCKFNVMFENIPTQLVVRGPASYFEVEYCTPSVSDGTSNISQKLYVLRISSGSPYTQLIIHPYKRKPCAQCGKALANKLCSGCYGTVYCSHECQVQHYNQHASTCKNV